MAVNKGDGQNYVTWTTILPEKGFYDVYTYIPMSAMYSRPSRNQNNQQRQGGNNQQQRRGPRFADNGTVYKYLLKSIEGEEKVDFKLSRIEDGWNKLGTFYFQADSVSIKLGNNVQNGRRAIADAVKFVKK